MEIVTDNNPRRRNLLVMSLIFIIFFLADTSVAEGKELSFPLLNLHVRRAWIIWSAAWSMLFWSWWQFWLNTNSFLRELEADVAGLKVTGMGESSYLDRFNGNKDHRFLLALRKKLTEICNSWQEHRINEEEGFPLNFNKFRLTVKFKSYLPRFRLRAVYGNGSQLDRDVTKLLSTKEGIHIIFLNFLYRPHLSDILIPHFLAALACLIGFLHVVGLAWLLSMCFILVVFQVCNHEKNSKG